MSNVHGYEHQGAIEDSSYARLRAVITNYKKFCFVYAYGTPLMAILQFAIWGLVQPPDVLAQFLIISIWLTVLSGPAILALLTFNDFSNRDNRIMMMILHWIALGGTWTATTIGIVALLSVLHFFL